MKFLNEIERHFEECYPKEGCGVLALVNQKLEWFPCTNVADDNDDFIIDSREYLSISRKADIVSIVHSHPDGEATPSQADIDNCNAVNLPYYIFSYPNMDMYKLEPEALKKSLYGRQYKFGVNDCFEAARDYYIEQGLDIPFRPLFEDDWWTKGLDYFTEEYINTWNFKKVEGTPQKGDLLIFKIQASVGDHCGVYMGNDMFFHHAENRLSCKENLYPFWKKYISEIYRYDA